MKVGDLVTTFPTKTGLYLIIDEDPSREHVVSNPTGIVLGKLYMLYDPETAQTVEMHEKWIEVINESR